MKRKLSISVLIATKNSAHELERTLKSLDWANEIIIVDSNSIDGTTELAKSYGATVLNFNYMGGPLKKRNWAIDTHTWLSEWIFIIDSDEVVPEEAFDELQSIVTNSHQAFAGYEVGTRDWFLDGFLEYAARSKLKIRLFRKGSGRYEQLLSLTESQSDMEVHEHVFVHGNVGKLNFILDHYAYPTVDIFIEKHTRYASWEAQMSLHDGWFHSQEDVMLPKNVRFKRLLRRLASHVPFRPIVRFLYVYLFANAWLDGRRGYYYASMMAFYERIIILKTRELMRVKST
jgi:glycosyltransferase involved in cell wall biosynthesis